MMSNISLNTLCVIHLHEEKKSICEGKFETILLSAVDEVFSSFGAHCKKAFYSKLEKTFKIKKQEIPGKLPEFACALEQIFRTGAKFIELRIIATLHNKNPNFEYAPSTEDVVFEEYVESLRSYFPITTVKATSAVTSKENKTTNSCTITPMSCLPEHESHSGV